MAWSELYDSDNQPTYEDIENFIGNDLWKELNAYLQQAYPVQPNMTYSPCTAQPGWNVKYKKSGKSLCTLYPMHGFFIALVVMGNKEMPEADLLIPFCSEYTQKLYQEVPFSAGGKWLMIHITDSNILSDVKNLIALRVRPVKEGCGRIWSQRLLQ
jgi:hypothetical protein